jgi:hypothetical protein
MNMRATVWVLLGVCAIMLVVSVSIVVWARNGATSLSKRWEEDTFTGKALTDFISTAENGKKLRPVDGASLYASTHWSLQENQRAFSFAKGSQYPVGFLATAVNVGYVIVDKSNGVDIVIDVLHSRDIDSL